MYNKPSENVLMFLIIFCEIMKEKSFEWLDYVLP